MQLWTKARWAWQRIGRKFASAFPSGLRLQKFYDKPKSPLDRLADVAQITPALTRLPAKWEGIDPFKPSKFMEEQPKKLEVQRSGSRKRVAYTEKTSLSSGQGRKKGR